LTSKPPEPAVSFASADPLSVSALPEDAWNGLTAPATSPFVDWRFLSELEARACVGGNSGWQPHVVTCRAADGRLRAAAPAYIKRHSHGEFVFDWAWARASEQVGLRWYPKLLVAAPFSPVPGPRLLGSRQDPAAGASLVDQIEDLVEDRQWSSAGVNFCSPSDAAVLEQAGWLKRFDWQFHWQNDGYRDFDDFLSRLKRKPRKNIRAERRKVTEAGWEFQWKSGEAMDETDIALIHRCYQSTFALYGNLPALNLAFFRQAARSFGPQFLACFALRRGKPLAMAAFWRDRARLYGRYWGSLDDTRDVHFETCYYQGIDYCIEHGLEWFEPGAQGEHKIRRGFLPQETRSYHFIRHPGLRAGIARYLAAEADALNQYRQQLETLNPFAET
jgi:predicted N-acyltransferase